MKIWIFFFFFFSSRRRHTRFKCDWSSDVCSSDLGETSLLSWDSKEAGNTQADAGTLRRSIDFGTQRGRRDLPENLSRWKTGERRRCAMEFLQRSGNAGHDDRREPRGNASRSSGESCKRTGCCWSRHGCTISSQPRKISGKSEQHELLRFSKSGLARIARSPGGRIKEDFRGEIPGAGEEADYVRWDESGLAHAGERASFLASFALLHRCFVEGFQGHSLGSMARVAS